MTTISMSNAREWVDGNFPLSEAEELHETVVKTVDRDGKRVKYLSFNPPREIMNHTDWWNTLYYKMVAKKRELRNL